ncbi:MAG: ShlB/FhaC/HecB family hemolysin secretion/activation protein [Sphingomicrobium sp.]
MTAASSAAAQAQPVAPTREEVTRPPPPLEPAQPTRLEVEGGIERAPCALDAPEYQAIRFTLRDVQFEGLQGLAPGDLTPAYAGLVGQEQPVSAICEIRDRAATILRAAGYIASVEVPEQRIADGTVRFKVLIAKLVQVRVRGDAGRAEQTIAGYLERLTDQQVFNRYDAERYLLLASDLPGYNVRLTLRPAGTVPGEVVGDVTVLRLAGVLDANVQNYGSHELGRWGGLLRAQLFGLTGLGDRTTVAFFETFNLKEQRTVQAGHDFRLGSEGLTLSGNFTYAWARPDIAGGADVRATTLFATAEASYPFIRRQSHTVRGALGMDLVNQDVEIENIDLTRDRLRVAFARFTADAVSLDFSRRGSSLVEPVWRVSGLMEMRRGLDIFDATDCGDTGSDCLGPGEVLPSRAEADGTATVLRGSVYGEYRPARLVTLALGVRGQWADDPLLSFEEFSAGNFTVGRGYDPGSLLGDRGIGVQAEVRLGSLVPAGPRTPAFQGYAFFDHARISNRDRLFVQESARRLSSIGAGLRTVFRGFNLDAAYAIPLKRVGPFDEKPDHRLLISLTTRLWPWSFK